MKYKNINPRTPYVKANAYGILKYDKHLLQVPTYLFSQLF